MSSTYGGDGRVLEATLVNGFDPANAFSYDVGYDSAGRPVVLTGQLGGRPRTTHYEAVSQGSTGAYDAVGRVPTMKADDGRVRSARVYGARSGLLLGEAKCFLGSGACTANGTFFDTGETTTYTGRNLKGFTDRSTSTVYGNSYRASGRLSATTATPSGATVGSLTQDYAEGFDYNGIGNLSAATSTRNASALSSQAGRASVVDTEVYTPVSAEANRIVDKVATITATRSVNGIPVANTEPTVDYAYDGEGHLESVSRSAGESERLYYGPTGELVYREVGGRTIYYVGEYATVIESGGGVEMDAHVVFAGTRIASVKPSRTLYYYRSRLGSVVATSVAGGVLGAQYRYTPYGAVDVAVNETPATASELGYTNALRLTGELLYLKSRVYDAQARVFIQPDVVDRLRYAYVSGDPINFADPSGLMALRSAQAAVEATFSAFHAQFGVAAVEERKAPEKAPASTKTPADPSTEQARNTDGIALEPEQATTDAVALQSSLPAPSEGPVCEPVAAVAMTDDQGNVVLGALGAPALMPEGYSAQQFVQYGELAGSSIYDRFANLKNFGQGGPWDLQRTQGGFDTRFIDAATIVIGLYGASAGIPFDTLMSIENLYAAAKSSWKTGTPMHPVYTNLPSRNVLNTQIGYDLYNGGNVTSGNQWCLP